jgi:hypothetical protein
MGTYKPGTLRFDPVLNQFYLQPKPMNITFSRYLGGYVVRLNRTLIGLILAPRADERDWRVITEHGDLSSAPTLQDAQRLAADYLLLDHAA